MAETTLGELTYDTNDEYRPQTEKPMIAYGNIWCSIVLCVKMIDRYLVVIEDETGLHVIPISRVEFDAKRIAFGSIKITKFAQEPHTIIRMRGNNDHR